MVEATFYLQIDQEEGEAFEDAIARAEADVNELDGIRVEDVAWV